MFEGAMLDVAIGVLLLFLVSSLLASAIVEVVGGFLHRRSKNLWDTIDLMLGRAHVGPEDQRLVDLIYRQPFVTTLVRPTVRRFFEPEHPDARRVPVRGAVSVRAPLSKDERNRRFYGPEHLPARDFADALIEVLEPGGTADQTAEQLGAKVEELPDGALKTQLSNVLLTTGDRFADVRAGIEDWYERHMTSVSVWYRRQTRWFLFAAGLAMAIVLNIDAVFAARTLYRDDEVRAAVVETAGRIAETECATDDSSVAAVDCIRAEVGEAVALPIGWGDDLDTTGGAWAVRVIGWLAVAGSVTLGAPFWFDLLRRAFAVRKRE